MMLTTLMRRLRREEEGYALVISMLLLSIMSVLLVVALKVGTSSLNQSSQGVEWSKTLTIAEAGVNDSVTRLGEDRNATNPCAISTATVCTGGGGQYQVSWSQAGSKLVITSVGYYPTMASPKFKREIQVTYQPVPSFRYAIFSQTGLTIANNTTVMGDLYSNGDVSVGTGAIICGSILSSNGGATLSNGSQILTDYPASGCFGKSGQVWTGGTVGIVGASGATIQGIAKAGAPSTVTCSPSSSNYAVSNASGGTGFTVNGAVTACGTITGVSGSPSLSQGTSTAPPVPVPFPQFTFDPNNYSSDPSNPLHLQCYPTGGVCGSNDSPTAISDFNAYVATHTTSLTGTFAVWQRSPSPMVNPGNCDTTSTTQICLNSVTLSGDFTLITNAPIDFANTDTISTTSPSVSSNMTVVSTYQPAAGTSCTGSGGDCSIYGQNSVRFDGGDPTNPNDGVVGLLYTTGKMAFKNHPNSQPPGEGALYAGSMDLANNYPIIYNSRVERVLGFGTTMQQVLWQELNA